MFYIRKWSQFMTMFFFLLNSYFIVLMTTKHILTQILITIIKIIWSRYIAFFIKLHFFIKLRTTDITIMYTNYCTWQIYYKLKY